MNKFKDYLMQGEDKLHEKALEEYDIELILKKLNEELSKDLSIKSNVKVVRENRSGAEVEDSTDLTKFIKFPFVKKMYINGDFYVNRDGEVVIALFYRYEHFDGGSNGSKIGTYFFGKDSKFILKRLEIK